MPTISLCMIAKDEEDYLEQCLESVKDIIDEIVIVDTGSTDKTKEIAKRFNAVVVEKRWNNDFSEARNESLKHATKDWILVLDADETISRKDIERVKKLTENNDYLGYMLVQRSYTDDSSSIKWVAKKDDSYDESRPYSGWVYSGITRLFKNDPRIRFQYPVHETVKESISKIGKIKATDIPIHHYGKVKPKDIVEEKSRMYLELGKKKAKQEHKPKFYYELGVQAMVLGKHDEAIKNLKKAIELNKQWIAPYISLSNTYCKEQRYDDAIAVLSAAKGINPNDSNIHNNLGVAYEMTGKLKEALEAYDRSINLNNTNAEAYNNAARILIRLGKVDKVIEILKVLIKLKPMDLNNYNNLGILYVEKKMFKQSMEMFNEALKIDPDNKETRKNIQMTEKLMKEKK